DELLLIGALEVEPADVATGGHFIVADLDHVEAVGHLLPDGLAAVQLIAALVDTGDLHAFTGDDLAAVGLLLVGQHAEQGGLARAVAADDADDGSLGNGQRQIIDQYPIAIALGNVVQFDDLIPQALAGRDVDLVGFAALLEFLG